MQYDKNAWYVIMKLIALFSLCIIVIVFKVDSLYKKDLGIHLDLNLNSNQ